MGRGVMDSVKVAGQLALRSENHDAAGVSELVGHGVVVVTEPDGFGQLVDRRRIACEKMHPARPQRPGRLYFSM